MENSGTVLIVSGPELAGIVAALLGHYGMETIIVSRAGAIDAIRTAPYDAVVVDAISAPWEPAGLARLRAAWRSAKGPARLPSPMVLLVPEEDLLGGPDETFGRGACVTSVLTEAALVSALEPWLDLARNHPGSRSDDLADLLGREGAAVMINRFHANLADSIAAIEAGEDKRAIGHRVGGLAGTLGFPVLSAAWLSLELDDGRSWPVVRALTIEAIGRQAAD